MAEQPPAAGTPPANTPAGGQEQKPPAQNEFIMNQEQFNARWGAKHGEIEKELGMSIEDAKAFIKANRKPPANKAEKLEGADLRMAKMEALMFAKVPSEKIPGLISRVQGSNKTEIEADIQQMITDGFITLQAAQPPQQQQSQPPNAAQGAGNPGVPGTPGKKTWKRSEIKNMSREDHLKNKDEIFAAMRENRITED
ncbi:MAG TPA: hypothetical protein PKL29_09975 [Methanothrix sp.]|jgi:hypothetical protein|nr:hypothetical protein [Methanothrix sp.]